MFEVIENTKEVLSNGINGGLPSEIEEYSELLYNYSAPFRENHYWLEVGECRLTQGWVLHLSSIITQVQQLFEIILPIIIEEQIPFKMVRDKDSAAFVLGGNMGLPQLAKLITIYPKSTNPSENIVSRLIYATASIKAPFIPTDVHLGGAVYMRYGSIQPLLLPDENGRIDKFIYNTKGELCKDPYSIPFEPPQGIDWPFATLKRPKKETSPNLLNKTYKKLFSLKDDIKGNVSKAVYFKGFLKPAYCVIKEGVHNIFSDNYGRDMEDRLKWQYFLHQKLSEVVPLPKTIDFWTEKDKSYLVVDFVKGIALLDYLKQINFNAKPWKILGIAERSMILDLLNQILDILHKLHAEGFVHRDVAPGNFLIDINGKIILIDLELAYSIKNNTPNPAFVLGTPGFVSPEQINNETPTIAEDIYGIGAIMITLFTGLLPFRFDIQQTEYLTDSLTCFIGDRQLAETIANCLYDDPFKRPTIKEIQNSVSLVEVTQKPIIQDLKVVRILDDLENRIQKAINGLVYPTIVIQDDLWYSKVKGDKAWGQQKNYIRYPWLYEGIGGILYLLARSKRLGLSIDACRNSIEKGWHFLEEVCLSKLPNLPPGLYNGAAGVAVALMETLHANLLQNNPQNRAFISKCLQLESAGTSLANGAAGQGLAVLQCASLLDANLKDKILDKLLHQIVSTQQQDGSWLTTEENSGKKIKTIAFNDGISGITFFLLQYLLYHPNPTVETSAKNALSYLLKKSHHGRDLFNEKAFKSLLHHQKEKGDERKGVLLTFIKAYEVFKDPIYKEIVEANLSKYPDRIVKNNFNQDTGLAFLGEIYLEAHSVFGNRIWLERAEWIAELLLYTVVHNADDSLFWLFDEFTEPTADLMVGNSGIIHFLLRYWSPQKLAIRALC